MRADKKSWKIELLSQVATYFLEINLVLIAFPLISD